MTQPEEIYVRDTRGEDDGYLDLIPRVTSFEQLQDIFHVIVDRSHGWDAAPPGQPVFKLVGFEVRGGPSFFNQVYRADGSRFPGVLINAYYPNHDVEPNWQPIPRYETPAFGDFTNGEGVWGLAVGGLVMPDGDTPGPLTLWPNAHPDQFADAVRGVGWYPMTDHIAAHPHWMYVIKPGGTAPTSTTWLGVFEAGELLYHVPLVPGMPLGSFDTFSGLGYIAPDGAWRWHVPGVPGEGSQ